MLHIAWMQLDDMKELAEDLKRRMTEKTTMLKRRNGGIKGT